MRYSIATLLAFVLWGCSVASAGAQAPPTLDELLKEYQALGLPLPPREAKLARYEAIRGYVIDGKAEPPRYQLAFELKPGTASEKPTLLTGLKEWQPAWDPRGREVDLEREDPIDLSLHYSQEDLLIMAIQCHARKLDKLAGHLLKLSRDRKNRPPCSLTYLAWDYWEPHLTRAKTDRAPVSKRLKDLMRRDPELDTEYNRALIKSLDLALAPRKSKPGTIESLIDDLVDYYDTDVFEQYWQIAERGFEAVPALIEHLDDDRLTRSMTRRFNNIPARHRRVGDIVTKLLVGLAGEDLGSDSVVFDRADKARAQKWWNGARNVGEETYLMRHVLSEKYVNGHLLMVVVAKYPKNIPSLYRNVLDERPKLSSSDLAEAVLQCGIPDAEKLDLLRHGARHKDIQHRLPALRLIKKLDKKEFTTLTLAEVENLPKDVAGPYWLCPEPFVAKLAIECDDPRVWQALEKAVKRAEVGLRLELLTRFAEEDGPHRLERLRLLARFLDDATVRERRSSKFSGLCAGHEFLKLEVRDYAALQIAYVVGIDVYAFGGTSKEWAKLHGQVRDALKRELHSPK